MPTCPRSRVGTTFVRSKFHAAAGRGACGVDGAAGVGLSRVAVIGRAGRHRDHAGPFSHAKPRSLCLMMLNAAGDGPCHAGRDLALKAEAAQLHAASNDAENRIARSYAVLKMPKRTLQHELVLIVDDHRPSSAVPTRRAEIDLFLPAGRSTSTPPVNRRVQFCVPIDTNTVERAFWLQIITPKNALFADSNSSGRTWATIATMLTQRASTTSTRLHG